MTTQYLSMDPVKPTSKWFGIFGNGKNGNSKSNGSNAQAKLQSIDFSFAMIEFDVNGIITTANENFLKVMGYRLDEVVGQHHKIFVDDETVRSQDYRSFWTDLANGIAKTENFKRITKNGTPVWLKASYMPIKDHRGNVSGVLKIAQNMTEQKLSNADFEGKINAIAKSQAVIEFNMDGTVIGANDNFLNVVGYGQDEIKGKHHRMFCEDSYTRTSEYEAFWKKLNNGEFDAGEYKRIGKNGKEIYLQAIYNPIFDLNGKPFKVVNFATDTTEQKLMNADFEGKIEAIGKSQGVIEFNLDGTIIEANENFLKVVGYAQDEIKGKHHRIFCEDSYTRTSEYEAFWKK
ncbi:MAG: PAS domain S-box protein, partial [Nitrospinales bacterium]